MTTYGNAWIVTMDDGGTEHERGWLRVEDGLIAEVHGGEAPAGAEDLGGAVVTPGFVNTHHHLYQTLTRARAQQADLFTWLKTLYPVWARIDEEQEYAAARCGLAELARSGCSTVFDHHYVFPRGVHGLVEAEIRAAQELGVRIVASRGSMDLGESDGGLPPDSLVEDIDTILADTERLHRLADGATGADRRRAVLALLGDDAADGGVGRRSRAASACSCTRTSPRRSRRTRTAASSSTARRSNTSSGSAGSPTMSGARTAFTCRTPTSRRSAARESASRTARPPTCGSAPASRRCARCSMLMSASGSESTAALRTSEATSSST